MRWRITLILISILILLTACNLPSSPPTGTPTSETSPPEANDPQVESLMAIQQASTIDMNVQFENGVPIFVKGRIPVQGADPGEQALNFIDEYKALYLQVHPDLDLKVHRVGD